MAKNARIAMIEGQLQPNAITDEAVVAAMGVVPREHFVPAAYQACAYADAPVALGAGRYLLSPLALAQMVQALKPQEHEKALVIGGNLGYGAALLAALGAQVTLAEDEPSLAAQAVENLKRYAVRTVGVVQAPLAAGVSAGAPYHMILIEGAAEQVPDSLWNQLADGGRCCLIEKQDRNRLVLGVGEVVCYRKQGSHLLREVVAQAAAPVLPGFAQVEMFTL